MVMPSKEVLVSSSDEHDDTGGNSRVHRIVTAVADTCPILRVIGSLASTAAAKSMITIPADHLHGPTGKRELRFTDCPQETSQPAPLTTGYYPGLRQVMHAASHPLPLTQIMAAQGFKRSGRKIPMKNSTLGTQYFTSRYHNMPVECRQGPNPAGRKEFIHELLCTLSGIRFTSEQTAPRSSCQATSTG